MLIVSSVLPCGYCRATVSEWEYPFSDNTSHQQYRLRSFANIALRFVRWSRWIIGLQIAASNIVASILERLDLLADGMNFRGLQW